MKKIQSDIKLIIDGEKALEAILLSIKEAKYTIMIRMYMWRDDDSGRKTINALTEKIKENPKIEIYIEKDAFGAKVYNLQKYITFGKIGGDIFSSRVGREFIMNVKNVFFKYTGTSSVFLFKYNRENNHSKIYLFDEGTADCRLIIGGMNISDSYFLNRNHEEPDKGGWHDYMVMITGDLTKNLYGNEFEKESKLITRKFREGATIIMNIKSHQTKEMIKEISKAKKSIIIEHGYITHSIIIRKLKQLSRNGVKVQIIMPDVSDGVYHANMQSIHKLLKTSILHLNKKEDLEVYLYKGMIHAKVMLIDEYTSIIGSANLTSGSFGLLKETNAIFKQKDGITKDLLKQLKFDISCSTRVTEDNLPHYNSFIAWIQRLFI